MKDWNQAEIAFRCQRLSVRLEKLAQNFIQIDELSRVGVNADRVLDIIRENKTFLDLTAIDLNIDSAYELAQIQRQLSRWHLSWQDTWNRESSRQEISTLSITWANRIRDLAGVLV